MDLVYSQCRAEGSTKLHQGYGIHSSLVDTVKYSDCTGLHNRHSFEAHRSYNLVVDGCSAYYDISAGISTHGRQLTRVVNCATYECGGGIIVRGIKNVVSNNQILGWLRDADPGGGGAGNDQSYTAGITVGVSSGDTAGLGIAGDDLIVSDNYINLENPNHHLTDKEVRGITVWEPLRNARITEKPPNPNRLKPASVPPAITISDTPRRITSIPSPIA